MFLFQNGPTQFVSGSKLPLPEEKHNDSTHTASEPATHGNSDSDSNFDIMEFPEVPRQPLQPHRDTVSTADVDDQEETEETKQFVPFISPPSLSSETAPEEISSPANSKVKDENMDMQDVLVAARAAVESAERAAAAARSAASITQLRISELTKRRSHDFSVTNTDNQDDNERENGDALTPSHEPTPDPSFSGENVIGRAAGHHQPERLPSMDDETHFSYPNLFTKQGSNVSTNSQSPRESK